jgi:lipopolysaccharide transport protein LptA
MNRHSVCGLLIAGTAVLVIALCFAGQPKSPPMSVEKYVIDSSHFEGTLDGALEFSKGVKVTGDGITMTCDTLKVWWTADGRRVDRAQALGNVTLEGRYVAGDKSEWDILGKSEAARYERKAQEVLLEGSVNFQARNRTTGAQISVTGDKLVYDAKSRRFRFERVTNRVRMVWEEPEVADKGATSSKEDGEGGS